MADAPVHRLQLIPGDLAGEPPVRATGGGLEPEILVIIRAMARADAERDYDAAEAAALDERRRRSHLARR